jgi:NAD(P)-dependent dehydrogenase (short-subunit alcohol dehydrogenase family)
VTLARTVLVTGAGRGLGLALVEEALSRGDLVIGTLRDEARGARLFELARRHGDRLCVLPLDVADEASCAALAERAARVAERIDVLVNNAGINSASHDIEDRRTAFDLEALSAATLDRMMRTNALGPVLVTRALVPLLARSTLGARVVNVSSRRGSLGEKASGGNYGYCMSKAALNMATRALAGDLAPRGITVAAVHPGAVRTSMAQPDADLSPNEAASSLLRLADRLTRAESGLFLEPDGAVHPW